MYQPVQVFQRGRTQPCMYDKNITIAIWMSPLRSSITVGVNARVGDVELRFPYRGRDGAIIWRGTGMPGPGRARCEGCQGQVVRAVKDVVSLLANIPDANIPDGLLVEPSLQKPKCSPCPIPHGQIYVTSRALRRKRNRATQAVWE